MDPKLKAFYQNFIAANPEIKEVGMQFDRATLINYAKTNRVTIPGQVWQNRAERGVYVVPPSAIGDDVAIAQVPSPMEPASNDTPTNTLFIPNKNPEFVPFGAYKDVEDILHSRVFYPVYITGLSGNGKSTMVEQACCKLKRQMIRINLNSMTDEEQLIGSKTLVDGNVEIVEGPVLIAMRTGAVLLIDEIDAGSANSLLCIQGILEGKPYYFKLKNEVIVPAYGFNIVATANTKGKGDDTGQHIGTNILNEAFLERFGVTFEQEYPTAKVEERIITNYMNKFNCLDESFAAVLAKWADAIRRTYESGGVDQIMTTRRLIHITTALAIFNNKNKAVELCCNRFDSQTKQAFIEMYKACDPTPTAAVVPPPAPGALDLSQLASKMV